MNSTVSQCCDCYLLFFSNLLTNPCFNFSFITVFLLVFDMPLLDCPLISVLNFIMNPHLTSCLLLSLHLALHLKIEWTIVKSWKQKASTLPLHYQQLSFFWLNSSYGIQRIHVTTHNCWTFVSECHIKYTVLWQLSVPWSWAEQKYAVSRCYFLVARLPH